MQIKSNATSTGGYIWPRMVANSTGVTVCSFASRSKHSGSHAHLTCACLSNQLHDYAVSGAACSNELTPRWLFPSVKEYEVPAFLTDFKLGKGTSHGNTPNLDPDETVFTMWIGTSACFFTTLPDYQLAKV